MCIYRTTHVIKTSIFQQENADISAGQILVCGAIIRAKVFTNGSEEEQQKILQQLLTAGKKRSYLSLACYSFIVDLFQDLTPQQFHAIVWPLLKEDIIKPWQDQTLDHIYVLMNAQNKFPGIVTHKFLSKKFGSPTVLSRENCRPLCELLLVSY